MIGLRTCVTGTGLSVMTRWSKGSGGRKYPFFIQQVFLFLLCEFVVCWGFLSFEDSGTNRPAAKIAGKKLTQLRYLIVSGHANIFIESKKFYKIRGNVWSAPWNENQLNLSVVYKTFSLCHIDDDWNHLLNSFLLSGRAWITMAGGDGDWVVAPLIEAVPPSASYQVPPALFRPAAKKSAGV